jgi:hypothetical protein
MKRININVCSEYCVLKILVMALSLPVIVPVALLLTICGWPYVLYAAGDAAFRKDIGFGSYGGERRCAKPGREQWWTLTVIGSVFLQFSWMLVLFVAIRSVL